MQQSTPSFWSELGLGTLGLLVVGMLILSIVSLVVGLKRHSWKRMTIGIVLLLLGVVLGYVWFVADILLNFRISS